MQKDPQIGSIVHLNSGSPDLKVVGFCGACKVVEVEWEANGEPRRSRFPLACLQEQAGGSGGGPCQTGQ
jgi:hypothetical protein